MFRNAADADEVLREWRRQKEQEGGSGSGAPLGAGGGRVLGGGAAGPSAGSAAVRAGPLGEVDDMMARMEARLARLDVEMEENQEAPRCGRRAAHPATNASRPTDRGGVKAASSTAAAGRRAKPASSASHSAQRVGELAKLEGEAKHTAQTKAQLRKRIAVLEQKASEAGLAPGTAAAPSASTCHGEDKRGHVVVAAKQDAPRSRPTSGAAAKDELGDAVLHRIGVLRRQVRTSAAELEALQRRDAHLTSLLTSANVLPAADELNGRDEIFARTFVGIEVVKQLKAVSDTVQKLQVSAGLRAPSGVRAVTGGATAMGSKATIPITVFSDGIMLYRGPFRPLGTSECDTFVAELMDDRLPYELKFQHQDGVLFDVCDVSSQTYASASAAARAHRVSDLASIESGMARLAPRTAEQLLQRLPESVVRDGRLVAVRSEIAAAVGKSAPHPDQNPQLRPDHDAMRAARIRRFQ